MDEMQEAMEVLGDLSREVRMHKCRCLVVLSGPGDEVDTNRCPVMLPVDQPLCRNCEETHLTGTDHFFTYSGAYMVLVPPECP